MSAQTAVEGNSGKFEEGRYVRCCFQGAEAVDLKSSDHSRAQSNIPMTAPPKRVLLLRLDDCR